MGPRREPVAYPAEILDRLRAACEADPGREACGFVVRRGAAMEVVALRNAADELHARDPAAFPRTARDAYVVDPGELLRLHRQLRASGGTVVASWHSHVEGRAFLSSSDRADALVAGRPVLPGAEYLVLGLRAGRVAEVRRFCLEGAAFVERPLGPPPTPGGEGADAGA